jgi:hypothetical protein
MKLKLCLILLISVNFLAQDVTLPKSSLTSSKLYVGIETGISLNKLRANGFYASSFQNKLAFVSGINVNYNYAHYLTLKASINYENKGAKTINNYSYYSLSSGIYYFNFNYINVPITASYNYSLNEKIILSGGLGPNLSFLLFERTTYNFQSEDETSSFKRIDLGLVGELAASYHIINKVDITAGFRETLGLIDIVSVTGVGVTFKTNSMAFILGLKYHL